MRNILILAGVASLAMTSPLLAQGKGNGNGGGPKGGGGPAKVERGGGGGPKANRGGGGGPRMEMRGGGQRIERGGGGQRMKQARGPERRMERPQKIDRQPVRQARVESRGKGPERVKLQRGPVREIAARSDRGAGFRDRQRDMVRVAGGDRFFANPTYVQSVRQTGLIGGCPPGLAAKNNGCLPPGQAKRLVGAVVPAALGTALLPPLYRSWYPDDDRYYYRTEDDYIYRIDRDRNYVDGFFPLNNDWTGAYYVGAAYPQDYLGYYNVPAQYQPWYADSGDYYYRYGDGAIYQVDRGDGLIEGIVSLLAGDFGIGQPLPAGYDVYNVPYGYRDQYVDGPDAWYRYNDGYIYQVDPTTRLVQAIVETLV